LHFRFHSHTLRRDERAEAIESAYTGAGVNIHLADTLKAGLKQKVRKTLRPEVLGAIGGFGGLFALDVKKYKRPVLVSSMDGVGHEAEDRRGAEQTRHDRPGPRQSLRPTTLRRSARNRCFFSITSAWANSRLACLTRLCPREGVHGGGLRVDRWRDGANAGMYAGQRRLRFGQHHRRRG